MTEENNGSHLRAVSGEEGMQTGEISIVPIDKDELYGKKRKRIVDLQAAVIRDRWELAGELTDMHDGELYINWGYPTWKMYIEQEVKMNVRVAHYLRAIFVHFANEIGPQLSENDRERMVEKLKQLGWTKAKFLVDVCTEKDWEEWVDKAMEMSVSDIDVETKRALVKKKGGDPDEVAEMKTLSCRFYSEQYEPVEQALELAKDIASQDKPKKSNLLSLICQSFVADNMGEKAKKGSHRDRMLRRLGAVFGVDLIAVDPDSNKVLFGKGTFGKISK